MENEDETRHIQTQITRTRALLNKKKQQLRLLQRDVELVTRQISQDQAFLRYEYNTGQSRPWLWWFFVGFHLWLAFTAYCRASYGFCSINMLAFMALWRELYIKPTRLPLGLCPLVVLWTFWFM